MKILMAEEAKRFAPPKSVANDLEFSTGAS